MSCCKQPSKKIHRQMTIEEILNMFPHKSQRLAQEITQAGLHCVGCQAATWETLEAGMLGHGMPEASIIKLVDRLNALLEEKTDPSTITITPKAAEKFIEYLTEEKKQGWGLRFAEELAGCNGYEYTLDLAEKATNEDHVFESCGINIFVNKALVPRLIGSQIDYVNGLQGSGFKISNPNARSSCGCGTSHNY